MEERIRMLEEELYILYSSKNKSNPTILGLIDEIIDKMLLLKSLLLDDTLEERRNPSLIFLEHLQNVLGNPQSIRIVDSRKSIYDPALAKFVLTFAKVLVNFKRTLSLPERFAQEFESETQIYLEKEMRRNKFSHDDQQAFYFLLQEEFPDKNSQYTLLHFLKWCHRRRQLKSFHRLYHEEL